MMVTTRRLGERANKSPWHWCRCTESNVLFENSLTQKNTCTQGSYTWKPLTWPLDLHLFETIYFRSLNGSTKIEWQEMKV